MTTDDCATAAISERFQNNLRRIEELSQRLMSALAQRQTHDPGLDAPSPEIFLKLSQSFTHETLTNPVKLLEAQAGWWGDTLKTYMAAQQKAFSPPPAAPEGGRKDPRFSNPLWDTNPYFNFLKEHYLHNAQAISQALSDIPNLNDSEQRRLRYFTQQLIDMMAPTNYLATNPDALEKAVQTEGESLVSGLENLVRDVESNQGELRVTLSDPTAFTLGSNIAATPGTVVFRNRILELIQYHPTTERVHKVPLLIFPPWINKFYIMDLKPQNSLVKWILDQGFTLFVVSWKNPDASYADFGLDDYVQEGFFEAIEAVKTLTEQPKVNTVGYCIAGTTLSLTMALAAKRKDTSIKSATFFTMLSDFDDQGEFLPFLTDDFVDSLERECRDKGYLAAHILSRTFSFLRPNELIYKPAIRSYMLGERPPAFDLLHWNGDGTNLPGRMTIEYLRGLCQGNRFADGGYPMAGEVLKPADIKQPLFSVACETDHIAAWKSCYGGLRSYGSKDKTFVLSQSGHVAGVINPPSRNKYGHYTHSGAMADLAPEDWRAEAEFTPTSWWPRWGEWLAKQSGPLVRARALQDAGLGPAPGTYVANG